MEQLTLQDIDQLLTTIYHLYALQNASTFAIESLALLQEFSRRAIYTETMQPLSSDDVSILTLLQPNLIQAYQSVCQHQQFQSQIAQLQQSLDFCGVVVVNEVGKVQLMTMQAATWLQFYFPGDHPAYQLPELLQSWIKYQIDRLKSSNNLLSPQLPLHCQQSNRKLTIRMKIESPGQSYLLLLAEEVVLSIGAALELLGLTPREAKILAVIIRGHSNREIASELQMSINTVRKHLEHIYEKLNVHSRTEAIAVALNRLGCLQVSFLI